MNRRLRRTRALACLAAVTLAGAAAASERVTVTGDAAAVDETKLARLVDLELTDARDIEHVTVMLSQGRAFVTMTRGKSDRSATLDVPSTGNVERTLALLVGELAAAPEPSPEPTLLPAAAPVPAITTGAEIISPESKAPRRVLGALVGAMHVRAFTVGGAAMLGPYIATEARLGDRTSVGLGGRYLVGGGDDTLGSVSAQWLSAGPYIDYAAVVQQKLALHVGAAIDVSWLRGSGAGQGERDASTRGVSPNAFVELRYRLVGGLGFSLGADGGYLGPGLDLRAEDRRVLRAAGLFAGARIGVLLEL